MDGTQIGSRLSHEKSHPLSLVKQTLIVPHLSRMNKMNKQGLKRSLHANFCVDIMEIWIFDQF